LLYPLGEQLLARHFLNKARNCETVRDLVRKKTHLVEHPLKLVTGFANTVPIV
jgi:hypothetical protein